MFLICFLSMWYFLICCTNHKIYTGLVHEVCQGANNSRVSKVEYIQVDATVTWVGF